MIWFPFCPKKPKIGSPIVILPPRKLRFSIKATFKPSSAAACYAIIPDGPPPTTNTSTFVFTDKPVTVSLEIDLFFAWQSIFLDE
jgi:hypothetical protein